MLRPFSIATIVTGLAAAISLACSDSHAPQSTTVADEPIATSRNSGPDRSPTLTEQRSNTAVRLFAVSPVNSRVVWVAGADGTYLRTTDGGQHWTAARVPGAETLQFRDVEAVNARVAYLLSIGSGEDSRIYKTVDGGRHWTLQFQNHNPAAFYDCFDFWSPRRGLTFSDATGNRFPAIKTTDGRTWHDIGDRLPTAQPGEAAFASSGTCVATQGERNAWIGTAGAARARILATRDAGATWNAYLIPAGFTQGTPVSGIASVAFRDRDHGILGGGDVVASTVQQVNVARSRNGGVSWTLTTPTPFPGAVYGLDYVSGRLKETVVATGPGGAAWTPNEGDSWSLLPGVTNCWAVAFAGPKAGWLVCGAGRIVKVSFAGNKRDDDSDRNSSGD
jgi:photosystem II stability/assembly factor-like uncharacterized protein